MLREDGSLELYESEAEFRASLPGWAARERFGIAFRHVEGEELAALQPGLSPRFVKATFVPGWKTVADPKLLGKAIWAYAETLGARFERRDSRGDRSVGDGARLRFADGRRGHGRRALVIAAGAWSHLLARAARRHASRSRPSAATTRRCRVGAFDVKRQLIFSGHGFVITPLSTGLRVGGAVELGGLERPPNYRALEGDAGEGAALPARAATRRRPRMDGLPPVAAGFAAGHRHVARERRTSSTPSATAISA